MRIDKSKQTTEKCRWSLETTMSNYMQIKWTTWKRNGQILTKVWPSKTEPGTIENLNIATTSKKIEIMTKKSSNKQKPRTR